MKIRIGSYDNKFWVEGKFGFVWKKLPPIAIWDQYDDAIYYVKRLRFDLKNVAYFDSHEKAHELAQNYLIRYSSHKVAVYVEVK
jgi:hypothetical protein